MFVRQNLNTVQLIRHFYDSYGGNQNVGGGLGARSRAFGREEGEKVALVPALDAEKGLGYVVFGFVVEVNFGERGVFVQEELFREVGVADGFSGVRAEGKVVARYCGALKRIHHLQGLGNATTRLRHWKYSVPTLPRRATSAARRSASTDAVESYLQVDLIAVVTSDAIFNKGALAQRDYDQIADLAKRITTVAVNSERVVLSTLNHTRTSHRFRRPE